MQASTTQGELLLFSIIFEPLTKRNWSQIVLNYDLSSL